MFVDIGSPGSGEIMEIYRRIIVALMLAVVLAVSHVAAQEQPLTDRTLVVGTKEAPPFAMKTLEGEWTGISIDLWRQIADELNLSFEFKETDLRGLLTGVTDGSLDVAVAALTVTSDREEKFDFTHPFYHTGLGIAVAGKYKSPWAVVLRSLFSFRFLEIVFVLFLLFAALGSLIWWFERKKNPQHFGGDTKSGIGSGIWWSAVTMTTVGYGDKAPITFGGRSVALIWMFSGIVLISFFTASITSTLTVSQLESQVRGPEDLPKARVGAIADTTGASYLKENHISFYSYKTADEGLRATAEGRVDSLVYDEPILRYLINSKYKGDLEVLPETFLPQDYGIALPDGNPLREPINQVLLEKIQDPSWQNTLSKYLGR
jgi:ABC-type amino acid transport substrate-binding protein